MQEQFAQLSDPHLSTLENVSASDLWNKRALGYLSWKRKRQHEHRPEVLQALQTDIAQFSFAQLLITGDLTHIGLPQEFQQAQAWLQALGGPEDIALVPGNHDACVRAPWDDTFALWQDYMASEPPANETGPEEFPTLRIRGSIAFIGLSTGVPKPPLMATGTAGAAQVQRLSDLLQQTREQGLFRVVYLHHCPIEGREKWRKRLTDAPAVQQALEANGAELVVHGHGHRQQRYDLDTRDGSVPVIAVPSASALGLHGADIAQYNCYGVEAAEQGWRLSIRSRVFNPQTAAFEAGSESRVDLAREHAHN